MTDDNKEPAGAAAEGAGMTKDPLVEQTAERLRAIDALDRLIEAAKANPDVTLTISPDALWISGAVGKAFGQRLVDWQDIRLAVVDPIPRAIEKLRRDLADVSSEDGP